MYGTGAAPPFPHHGDSKGEGGRGVQGAAVCGPQDLHVESHTGHLHSNPGVQRESHRKKDESHLRKQVRTATLSLKTTRQWNHL